MQYSPKLKKVMEEIKVILKKNDIAGVVILHSLEDEPAITKESVNVFGFTEFLFHINTSYSAASFENDRLKVRGRAIHYKSKEERDIKIAGTVNMFDHLSEWTGKLAMQAFEIKDQIEPMIERAKDDEGGEGFSSHSQQNN